MCRTIFSIITIASSTMKPVEMVSAIKDRLLRLNPRRCITPKVPTIETGSAKLGMTVAHNLRKNRNITITTRPMVRRRVNSTSVIEARMGAVRSINTATSTEGGSCRDKTGICRRTESTVSITLAPG